MKLYIADSKTQAIEEFNLSTAWDITTITFVHAFTVSGISSNPYGVFFRPDGRKMYVASRQDFARGIAEYDLGTPWDTSTASLFQKFIPSPGFNPEGVFFRDNGLKMYIAGSVSGDDSIYEYDLEA